MDFVDTDVAFSPIWTRARATNGFEIRNTWIVPAAPSPPLLPFSPSPERKESTTGPEELLPKSFVRDSNS